jgi:hypothetical protein
MNDPIFEAFLADVRALMGRHGFVGISVVAVDAQGQPKAFCEVPPTHMPHLLVESHLLHHRILDAVARARDAEAHAAHVRALAGMPTEPGIGAKHLTVVT